MDTRWRWCTGDSVKVVRLWCRYRSRRSPGRAAGRAGLSRAVNEWNERVSAERVRGGSTRGPRFLASAPEAPTFLGTSDLTVPARLPRARLARPTSYSCCAASSSLGARRAVAEHRKCFTWLRHVLVLLDCKYISCTSHRRYLFKPSLCGWTYCPSGAYF